MFSNTQNGSLTLMLVAVTILQTSIIFSLHLVIPVDSATALEEIEENPAHPGKCYVRESGVVHELGSTWQVPEMLCAQATCYRSGSATKFLVAYQTCGLISADPDCDVVEDLTLPYPSCCPRIRCNSRLGPNLANLDILNSPSKKIDEKANEIQISSSNSVTSNSYPASVDLPEFQNQQTEAELVENRPSNLIDMLTYPKKNNKDYYHVLQATDLILPPLLVTIP